MKISRYIIYFLALLAAGMLAAGCFWLWLATLGREYQVTERISPELHLYGNEDISLSKIKLRVYYVVPKNREERIEPGWTDQIDNALKDAVSFYRNQFRNYSDISYEIYPEPVILSGDNLVYDTEKTDGGNPNALRKIYSELETGGRLGKEEQGVFTGNIFIYEGVGASGEIGSMILARAFLSREEYSEVKASLFAHELGHVFGLPDRYDLNTDVAFSDGLMGGGRKEPIQRIHLEGDLLAGMGLISKK